MSDREILRLGLAGFGWWGQHIARRLARHPHLRIAAVADVDPERRAAIAAAGLAPAPDLDALLGDTAIDAIVLATPHMGHEAEVLACAAAGKPVFCEKPLALTLAAAHRAVSACRAAGLVVGIGHERRFEPALIRLATLLRSGALGTPMHAEAAFSHDKLAGLAPGGWRTSKALSPGAAMTGMGVHLTDLFVSLFGPVESVQAQTRRRALDWETGDVTSVQLSLESGMTATMSAILATPLFIRTHVFGSAAHVEVRNDTHPDTPGGRARLVLTRTGSEPEIEDHPWTDTVTANLEAFADAVAGRAPYPYTPDELVHNIAVFEAIVASAESGETVRVARHAPLP